MKFLQESWKNRNAGTDNGKGFRLDFPESGVTIGTTPETMKIELTPEKAAALAKYAALARHTPAEFLNRYLSDNIAVAKAALG